jgi:hypothetical protein
MLQHRPKGADASDARQSRRKELIAVKRGMPGGLGGPGAHPEARACWGKEKTSQRKLRRKIMNRLALNKAIRPQPTN